jgi:hypothetical protein
VLPHEAPVVTHSCVRGLGSDFAAAGACARKEKNGAANRNGRIPHASSLMSDLLSIGKQGSHGFDIVASPPFSKSLLDITARSNTVGDLDTFTAWRLNNQRKSVPIPAEESHGR